MSSAYDAAKKALETGDPDTAVAKASEALAGFRSSSDDDGLEKAMKTYVAASIATDKTEEAKPQVKDLLIYFKDKGNKAGQARMLILQGELSCAEKEPEAALDLVAVMEDLISGAGAKSEDLSQQLLSLKVSAQLLKGNAEDAMAAAKELRSLAGKSGNKEQEAAAWHSIAGVYELQTSLEEGTMPSDVLQAAEKARTIYSEIGDKKGEAAALATAARAMLQQEQVSSGLERATEALNIFRGLKRSRGMVSALEIIVQAYSLQDNPMGGLQVANKELATLKDEGNLRGQADVLDMIAQTHAMLGQPRSAMTAAKKALDIHVGLEDKVGEGSMLHTIAEMQRATGNMAEATASAEGALRCFKQAGMKWGEEQAMSTLGVLLVQRGQPEKSPKRAEVQRALKELAKAIEQKKGDDVKAAEEKLNAMERMVAEGEIQGVLTPILLRDPTAVEFLEGLGWKFLKDDAKPQKMRSYPHKGFYLHMIMTGMNFGPQFRVVHPAPVGRTLQDDYATVCAASQLPETEAWQMDLGYRPGLLDSCLQCGASMIFP
mmetsp:Transcript_20467/g.61689  ORF Transcript_20467/g.61689 Transcript_20467/m.61689 type:complete len:546 (+) Transcript_20467:78-1715(+)